MSFPGRRVARRGIPWKAFLSRPPENGKIPSTSSPRADFLCERTAVLPGPLKAGKMTLGGSRIRRDDIPGAAVLPRPPKNGKMSSTSSRRARMLVPRKVIFPSPLKGCKISPSGSHKTNLATPRAVVVSCPPEHGNVPAHDSQITGSHIPRTTLCPGPLQNGQIASFGSSAARRGIPGTAFFMQPLQNLEMSSSSSLSRSCRAPWTVVRPGTLQRPQLAVASQSIANHESVAWKTVLEALLQLRYGRVWRGEAGHRWASPSCCPPAAAHRCDEQELLFCHKICQATYDVHVGQGRASRRDVRSSLLVTRGTGRDEGDSETTNRMIRRRPVSTILQGIWYRS